MGAILIIGLIIVLVLIVAGIIYYLKNKDDDESFLEKVKNNPITGLNVGKIFRRNK